MSCSVHLQLALQTKQTQTPKFGHKTTLNAGLSRASQVARRMSAPRHSTLTAATAGAVVLGFNNSYVPNMRSQTVKM